MTDPMTELRQASAEVSGVEVLSPGAEAVWDSFCQVVEDHGPPRLGLAAALRAAADRVVPIAECRSDLADGCCERSVKQERSDIRILLRAIAAELDPTTETP